METNKELMRAEFEKSRPPKTDLTRRGEKYKNPVVQQCWEAWQAALSQRSEAKPLGYVSAHEIRQLQDPRNSRMIAVCAEPIPPDVTVAIYTAPALSAQRSEAVPVGQIVDGNGGHNTPSLPPMPKMVWFGQPPAIGALIYASPPAAPVALSDAVRNAIEFALNAGRGTSGRIILEHTHEESLRNILATATQPTDADKRDAERYRKVKKLTKEQYILWRGMYACSDEALDAAIAASAKEAA